MTSFDATVITSTSALLKASFSTTRIKLFRTLKGFYNQRQIIKKQSIFLRYIFHFEYIMQLIFLFEHLLTTEVSKFEILKRSIFMFLGPSINVSKPFLVKKFILVSPLLIFILEGVLKVTLYQLWINLGRIQNYEKGQWQS